MPKYTSDYAQNEMEKSVGNGGKKKNYHNYREEKTKKSVENKLARAKAEREMKRREGQKATRLGKKR